MDRSRWFAVNAAQRRFEPTTILWRFNSVSFLWTNSFSWIHPLPWMSPFPWISPLSWGIQSRFLTPKSRISWLCIVVLRSATSWIPRFCLVVRPLSHWGIFPMHTAFYTAFYAALCGHFRCRAACSHWRWSWIYGARHEWLPRSNELTAPDCYLIRRMKCERWCLQVCVFVCMCLC